MEKQESIIATITSLLKLMVDEPEAVQVSTPEIGQRLLLRIAVAPRDKGKVIGKQGRTARSLRVIVSAIGMTSNQRISLDIDG